MMLRLFQRPMVQVVSILFLMVATTGARAQNANTGVPPIIDVHHHAMDSENGSPELADVSKYLKIYAPLIRRPTRGRIQDG